MPLELGVHRAALPLEDTPAAASSGKPTYVRRTQDDALGEALRSNSFVVLVGDSTAGKSRSAYEAMQRLFSDRVLLVPSGKGSLRTLDELGVRLPDCLIWLDELEGYLGPDGLSLVLLERLIKSPHGRVTLLATMRGLLWTEYTLEGKGSILREERIVLRQARAIQLARRNDDAEVRRAHKLEKDDPRIAASLPRLKSYGLAEYLAAGPALLEKLLLAKGEVEPCGAAIVRAAVDWQRAGLRRPVPRAILERLYPHYLESEHPRYRGADAFAAGLAWATEAIHGRTTPALVMQVAEDGFQAFDYLVDYFQHAKEHPVPQSTWQVLPAELTEDDLYEVGWAAYSAASEAGKAVAALNLTQLLSPSTFLEGAAGEAEARYLRVLTPEQRAFYHMSKAQPSRASPPTCCRTSNRNGIGP
jgi:hypothetical protein